MRTVGGLAVAIGAGLVAGSVRPTVVRPLGVASAATFLAADVIGYRSGRLGAVYLLDAAAEAVVIAGRAAASAPGAAAGLRRAGEAELRRLARLTATASEDAASVQEAAFLVSS